MIHIQNLSLANIDEAIHLVVDDWQRKYVLPNAEMIAWAYVDPQNLFPLALYDNETLVGLAFVRREKNTAIMTLQQIMIGQTFQSKGFGSDGTRRIVEWIEEQFDCQLVQANVAIGNQRGRDTLETAGFMKRSTDLDKREIEMIYIMK
ncbi:acyl-coa n-acyltransferase [Trichococcus palustris]|jgi:diamine N-acetyltransferase|uniref:Acyl-coa n-acyltransferase n=1 Tax=Trichococcus palustris TaxID=140314 RepID=A0A143Y3W8_9LACT|nr:GNAT family N-acetyltransferase [Trichococcus palustris]CZQ81045.1 acyl-coa n-acyltransferase [Trichococcus palustris]SFK63381.1 Acetyltransferase (GNAT) domain-containing protein [Trichococcus palustris]